MKRLKTPIKLFFAIVITGMLLLPLATIAQDLPCDGNDPYSTCPLDTWVWILAAIAVIFAVFRLYRKKESSNLI
jgi:hypothetical protein